MKPLPTSSTSPTSIPSYLNPRISDAQSLSRYRDHSAAQNRNLQTPPLPDSTRKLGLPPGREAVRHNPNPIWTPIDNPWPSNTTSPADFRTPHPSELPPRASDQEYSAAWDPNANTPPLPVAAARFEDFGRARGTPRPSRLSSVVSMGDHEFGGQQRGEENNNNSPDYWPTSPPGSGEPMQDVHATVQRKRRSGFTTPDNLSPEDSPYSPSTSSTQESQISHKSAGKTNIDDRKPAQLATDKLWETMYQKNDAAVREDLALIREGVSDIAGRQLRPQAKGDEMAKK
ncbi:hypothetical protein NHQ30_007428 [Ciborinia camelliae]|nr:hypothetical protein NHQ30_007428 [Ciborinia camelliae]